MTEGMNSAEGKNGTNSLQAWVHIRMIAGYWAPHFSLNSVKHSLAAAPWRGIHGSDILGNLIPVLAGGVAKDVAQQVSQTSLHNRVFPDGGCRLRQSRQPVAHYDAHISGAALFDLGQHRQSKLRQSAQLHRSLCEVAPEVSRVSAGVLSVPG
jgi:hypothetical protein